MGSGSTLDIFQVSNSDTAAVNAPVLLILSVPNDTVDMTKTFFGATAGAFTPRLAYSFKMGAPHLRAQPTWPELGCSRISAKPIRS